MPASPLLIGFDNPFMPASTFGSPIADGESWEGFSNEDLSLLAYGNAIRLFPNIFERMQKTAAIK
ncbi:hypothetical protein [Caballeronia sp. SBC2]|uniref:hypothetical protein n=1 Tax=Caballeronia sp. SBC2 TaxID=2705547 RepID=UPI0013ECA06B|nr:hypothetical protein [Caballeronia sp. SBC2]